MKPRVLHLLIALLLLCAAAPALLAADAPDTTVADDTQAPAQLDGGALAKIEPLVLKELEQRGLTTFLVYMHERADFAVAQAQPDTLGKRQSVVRTLQATAARSQASVLAYLHAEQSRGSVKSIVSYWVFNGLAVTADRAVLATLAARPDVERIQADHVRRLADARPEDPTDDVAGSALAAIEWNVAKVRAPEVWNNLGVTGQGVVVANIDSGVYYPHPALQRSYRGYNNGTPDHNYNWFDPTRTYINAPNDGHGHGTHTMGTIVGVEPNGANQIGVAPGAQWIAVKAFTNAGETTDAILHAAFQWILAPTDLNGQNPNPARAPDIVSNSWGDPNSSDQTFWQDVLALRAAGIMAFFAGGNAGPGSGTVDAPGSFPHAVAVGATNSSDGIGSFSGRGPSPWGEIKPDVVAPGVSIRSAVPPGIDSSLYQGGWNGTSMATPHGAAVAALLWQAQPGLTITATEYVLTSTSVPLPGQASSPNNDYGWGRLDAYQAVTSLNGGRLWGRVTDAATGQPVTGTAVLIVRQDASGSVQTTTDARGYYTVTVGAGLYQATASNFWYITQTVSGIQIDAGYTTVQDFALARRPGGVLSGRISAGGAPVTATITLADVPATLQAGIDGRYAITLPAGSYDMHVRPATGLRQSRITGIVVGVGDEIVRDVELASSPRLLLVDADAWSSGASRIVYWQNDLDSLLYTFDLWRVTSTANALPSPALLRTYDIVIWHQPRTAPGSVGAWPLLAGYMDGGGRLLISGQDVGYWDDREAYRSYYRGYLHARFVADSANMPYAGGVAGDLFTGITLTLNTSDSAANQDYADLIAPFDDAASTVLSYTTGITTAGAAGLRIVGDHYQAIYLAFGLEGVGPAALRQQTLQQALSWLSSPVLRKTANVSTAAPGQEVQFTLLVANNSPAAVDTVMLTDTLPAAFEYVEGSASGGLQYDSARNALYWNGTLAAHASLTLTFTARLGFVPGGGFVANTAYLSSGGAISMPATASVTVVAPDLRSSTKQAQPALARSGDEITYTITLTNTGVGVAPVSLLDPLPDGVSYVPGSASSGMTFNPGFNRVEWTGVVTAISLEVQPYTVATSDDAGGPAFSWMDISGLGTRVQMYDESLGGPYAIGFPFPFFGKTYTEFYLSSNGWLSFVAPTGTFWNNVCLPDAQAPAAMIAPFWDDLYPATGDVYFLSGSDTLVVSYVNVPGYSTGGPYTFQAILRADGTILFQYLNMQGTVTDATIGMQDETRTRGMSIVCNQPYVHNRMAIRATPNVGGTAQRLSFRVRVHEGLPLFTPLVNRAWVSAGGMTTTVAATVTVNTVDLTTSSKAVGSASLALGESAAYTVTVRNTGTVTATVHVTDALPAVLVYTPDSASNGAIYDSASRSVLWSGAVAPGAAVAITFAAKAAAGTPDHTTITNTAVIADATGRTYERSAATVYRTGDLSDSRKEVAPASTYVGGIVTYTITVANGGGGPTTFTVTDTLPAGISYVAGSAQAGHGTVSFDAAQQRFVWSGSLAGEHQTYLRFAARAGDIGMLNNTAQIADVSGSVITRAVALHVAGPTPTMTPVRAVRVWLPVILRDPDAPAESSP